MKKKLLSLFLIPALLWGCAGPVHPPAETAEPVSGDGLTVHFIDVGQADCTLLECGGEYMIIDGGSNEDGPLVVSYLEQQGVEELAAVVCSHEEHVGGLPSVLAEYPAMAVYAPAKTGSSDIFYDFVCAADQQGLGITIPQPGDTFHLGEAQITVLGPTLQGNDTSIVLRVDYGDNSFLFTGDTDLAAENDMLDFWETNGNTGLFHADVLKVGSHGSAASTGSRFLSAADPDYGVISAEEAPDEQTLSRLTDAGAEVFRTDRLGTVVAATDGREITFTWTVTASSPASAESAQTQQE